jgi:pilus assembly protein CpaB
VRSRLLTVTLAGVLALIGVIAILAYVRQANERAVNGLKAETVMVAKGPIAAGTTLNQAKAGGLLGTETVPVSSVTDPLVSVNSRNGNEVVSSTVVKGQVMLQNMVAASAASPTASNFVIPSGMVAVSVDMCVSEAVADYIAPGSYVAVFDTVVAASAAGTTPPQRSCDTGHEALSSVTNNNAANTQLVLPKAEVLAVGQNPGTASASGSTSVTATDPAASSAASASGELLVTLAVNQADAERLILIDEVGLPYMALLGSSSSVGFQPPVNLFSGQP